MFRCDNCGSGYSAQTASSWTSCPRCLAREKLQAPLTFELGWQRTPRGSVLTAGEDAERAEVGKAFAQFEARRLRR